MRRTIHARQNGSGLVSSSSKSTPTHQEAYTMSDASKQRSWTRPAAMAIPKGGFFKDKVEQGRYGPIFPKTPACYGFSILAKVIPGREERFYEHAGTSRRPSRPSPIVSLCSSCTTSSGCSSRSKGRPISCIRASSIRTLTSTPRMPWLCSGRLGSRRSSKTSKVFLRTGRRTLPAFVKFVREHQCPSFLEYGEYPYVSADEIKKALKLKAAFSNMLDQMQ